VPRRLPLQFAQTQSAQALLTRIQLAQTGGGAPSVIDGREADAPKMPKHGNSLFHCRRRTAIHSVLSVLVFADWLPYHAGGFVRYVPPFDLIRRSVEISTVKGELRVNVSYEEFIRILKMMIAGVEVNDEWYTKAYEDIGKAIQDGIVQSPQQHFVDDGYFEGRLPFPMRVDEKWYLQQNPDVADSVRRGALPSGQAHFDEDGYREGRLPFNM
jgi:hypothetical protein